MINWKQVAGLVSSTIGIAIFIRLLLLNFELSDLTQAGLFLAYWPAYGLGLICVGLGAILWWLDK